MVVHGYWGGKTGVQSVACGQQTASSPEVLLPSSGQQDYTLRMEISQMVSFMLKKNLNFLARLKIIREITKKSKEYLTKVESLKIIFPILPIPPPIFASSFPPLFSFLFLSLFLSSFPFFWFYSKKAAKWLSTNSKLDLLYAFQ